MRIRQSKKLRVIIKNGNIAAAAAVVAALAAPAVHRHVGALALERAALAQPYLAREAFNNFRPIGDFSDALVKSMLPGLMMTPGFFATSGATAPSVSSVFATTLYTGNNSARSITNGIDLAGLGGLVWMKPRSATNWHHLEDSVRGVRKSLATNSTDAQVSISAGSGLTSFNSNGFSLGSSWDGENTSGDSIVAWSFARAARFFDVVTWTGNGTAGRTIPHSLGVTPGLIIVKRLDIGGGWNVRHRSATGELYLNNIDAQLGSFFFITGASSADFTLGSNGDVNGSGGTYVAYLFAHDDAADGIIQCGQVTAGSAANLGWQPQWILHRWHTQQAFWHIVDSARGMSGSADPQLYANGINAEPGSPNNILDISGTGFTPASSYWGSTYPVLYVAIRAA